jgi:hypothetical protein
MRESDQNQRGALAWPGAPGSDVGNLGLGVALSSRPQLHHPTDGTLTDIPTQTSFERYTKKYY